jgi:hypothetical protein
MSLKEKYPDANYDPKPDCRFCGGTGQREKKLNSILKKKFACICLYVDHEWCEEMGIELGKSAKELKEDMFGA